tara:strand:+ start:8468 stop:9166 length:699 start_codon:yes stop_codon:yes gene_type:complete
MEQQLIEDLVVESVRIYGNDVFYCPRRILDLDKIYGEDTVSEYKEAFMVEMYIRSVDGYEGDGIFLSKFGLEVRDQITFSIAKRTYSQEVGVNVNNNHPKEGDLIFIQLNPDRNQLYQIKYVNDRAIFYQFGGLQVYDLVCEVFEYSGEKLDTGIAAIDLIERDYTINLSAFGLLTQDGYFISDQDGYDIVQGQYSLNTQTQDYNSDNEEIAAEGDDILDWGETDPFSEGVV